MIIVFLLTSFKTDFPIFVIFGHYKISNSKPCDLLLCSEGSETNLEVPKTSLQHVYLFSHSSSLYCITNQTIKNGLSLSKIYLTELWHGMISFKWSNSNFNTGRDGFWKSFTSKKKNHKKPFIRHHYQEYTQWGSDLLYKHFLKLEKDNYIILLKINFNRF